MSAKDPRKSIALDAPPELAASLRAYARRHRDRSLAAACRRALRARLAGAPPEPRAQTSPKEGRRLRLRLQLEPELRLALGVDATPARLLSLIAAQLGVDVDGS